HNQGDSLNALSPGINGPTSKAGVRNADDNLRQILDYLYADAQLAAATDVIVTSDHGFATISKHDVDARHRAASSYSAREHYEDVPEGFLPPGFLAIDLAHALQLPLYDPDRVSNLADGSAGYLPIGEGAHPRVGHGLIGGSGRALDHTDAQVVVAANGGSDLIYLPDGSAALAQRLVGILASLDYVGALFADDRFGALPGALPLSSIALRGHSKLPRPAIVVSFATFTLAAAEAASDNPLQNAIQIADTPLQQGQGMHGSFGRDNTYNFMAASGPDFKSHYRDPLPVSNADIVPTVLRILCWSATPHGALTGRALAEALTGARAPAAASERCVVQSPPAADGRRTVLEYQRFRTRLYPDQAALGIVLQQDRTGCQKH
ncbi:MAG: alkaline phosphatase family protein, partial [Steroidobacteraceae bacterium]